MMGAMNASIQSWSDTGITCTSPVHDAGIVDVTVERAEGVATTLVDAFTFTTPEPTITSVSPGMAGDNGNTTITINGTDFGSDPNGGTVFFGTQEALSYLSWDHDTIRCTLPPRNGAKIVAVMITTGDGRTVTAPDALMYNDAPQLFNPA